MDAKVIQEAIRTLETMEGEVTDWEAEFLESLQRRAYAPTGKQLAVLARMVERYLENPHLAAELRGQERLF